MARPPFLRAHFLRTHFPGVPCVALVLAGALSALTCPARASDGARVVIELFTSQGCASCQPASRLIADYAREPDVIALTLPVTYWDYLGWKDEFGLAAFTERQRAYASLAGERQVFTPQTVVNGEPSRVTSDRDSLDRSVRAAQRLRVPVKSREQGDRIAIEVGAGSDADMRGEVWVLPVLRRRTVTVGRGENKGRVIDYVNVVRGLHHVGTWSGKAAHYDVPHMAARMKEADAYVVVLQGGTQARPARILGAAKGPGL